VQNGTSANATRTKPGCIDSVRNDYRGFFIPFAVFTLFLAILTLLEFFFICCVLVRKR
jgi:hypothetical protein